MTSWQKRDFRFEKIPVSFSRATGPGGLLAAALLTGRVWWLAAHDSLPTETRCAAVRDGLSAAREQALAATEARLEALQAESIARQIEPRQAARMAEALNERKGG